MFLFQYSLNDPDGRMRIVMYKADATGFHATVKTNEPGTAPENPADVVMMSSATTPAPSGGEGSAYGGYGGSYGGNYGSSSVQMTTTDMGLAFPFTAETVARDEPTMETRKAQNKGKLKYSSNAYSNVRPNLLPIHYPDHCYFFYLLNTGYAGHSNAKYPGNGRAENAYASLPKQTQKKKQPVNSYGNRSKGYVSVPSNPQPVIINGY